MSAKLSIERVEEMLRAARDSTPYMPIGSGELFTEVEQEELVAVLEIALAALDGDRPE